jgi:hypothetical protein
MWKPRIRLELTVLQKFPRASAGGEKWTNLVVFSMHHKNRHVGDLQIFAEFRLCKKEWR